MLRAGAESGLPPVLMRCSSAREPTTAAALPLAERLSAGGGGGGGLGGSRAGGARASGRGGSAGAGVARARRLAVSRPEVAQASGLVRSMGPGARAAVGPARAVYAVREHRSTARDAYSLFTAQPPEPLGCGEWKEHVVR